MKDFAIFIAYESQGGIETIIANYEEWRRQRTNITSLEFDYKVIDTVKKDTVHDLYHTLCVTFTTE